MLTLLLQLFRLYDATLNGAAVLHHTFYVSAAFSPFDIVFYVFLFARWEIGNAIRR